MEIEKVA